MKKKADVVRMMEVEVEYNALDATQSRGAAHAELSRVIMQTVREVNQMLPAPFVLTAERGEREENFERLAQGSIRINMIVKTEWKHEFLHSALVRIPFLRQWAGVRVVCYLNRGGRK